MSKVYDLSCAYCGTPYQDTVLLSNFFCSSQCEALYWAEPHNDRQVSVTTVCPQCKNDFTRKMEYILVLMPLTGLMLCPECDNNGSITIVGNSKVWSSPSGVE